LFGTFLSAVFFCNWKYHKIVPSETSCLNFGHSNFQVKISFGKWKQTIDLPYMHIVPASRVLHGYNFLYPYPSYPHPTRTRMLRTRTLPVSSGRAHLVELNSQLMLMICIWYWSFVQKLSNLPLQCYLYLSIYLENQLGPLRTPIIKVEKMLFLWMALCLVVSNKTP